MSSITNTLETLLLPSSKGGAPQVKLESLINLPPNQLQSIKQQIESDLTNLQDAIMSFKDAQIKMQEAGNCLRSLTGGSKEVLVPVTGSLFVRGEIEDSEKVLVEIGTGFIMEKTIEQAEDYFKRKVEFLSKVIEAVQAKGRDKTKERSVVGSLLEVKIQQLLAAQQAAAGAPSETAD